MFDFFRLGENNTDIKTEILSGISVFGATVYLLMLNPVILASAGMPYNGVLTAGILISALSCMAMGLFARSPLAVLPGAGLSYFAAFNLILDKNISWETMLGTVFWSSLLFLLLSFFKTRYYLNKAIPRQIRLAVSAGIGLMLAYKGILNSGFLVSHPLRGFAFGGFNAVSLTFSVGLLLTLFLCYKKIKSAFVLSLIFISLISFPVGRLYGDASAFSSNAVPFLNVYQGLVASPDFSLFLKLDFIGSLQFSLWPVIFSFFFIDFFEALAIYGGFSEKSGKSDAESEDSDLKRAMIVGSASGILGGLLGTIPPNFRAESAAGLYTGGKTGLSSLVTGVLYLLLLFFSPLLSLIPDMALAPVLIISGGCMATKLKTIIWDDIDEALPAFLTLVLILFTQSILTGFCFGVILWTLMKLMTPKRNEIGISLIVIDSLAILYLIFSHLSL